MEPQFNERREPVTARDMCNQRMIAASTMQFIMDTFQEYASDEDNWKEKVAPVQVKFREFLELIAPGEPIDAKLLVEKGLSFIMTNPMFSVHEYAAAGANLTKSEQVKFVKELHRVLETPAQRKQILVYIAACGYEVILHFMKEAEYVKAIEDKKASLTEIIGATLVKAAVHKQSEPWLKALRMLEKLEEHEIVIDKEGKVSDPRGILAKSKQAEKDYGREQSENSATGKSTEGFPGIPENLN